MTTIPDLRRRPSNENLYSPVVEDNGHREHCFVSWSIECSKPDAGGACGCCSGRGGVSDQPAPYDHELQRLSEILGALHFLRGICNSNEGQKWRDEAQNLIGGEAPNGKRHDEMVASFNRGYLSFQSYRTCTSTPRLSSAAISKKAQKSLATSPLVTGTNVDGIRCRVSAFWRRMNTGQ